MKQYLELLQRIVDEGVPKEDRTGREHFPFSDINFGSI